MSKKPKFELSFSLNVLHHLGVGLYSNTPAVLSEMVANAWDSGATRITITLDQDSIVIEDNGRGMSLNELNERYLRVGYQKRKEESVLIVEGEPRHVMGRKGIGKLSAFSIANIVDVQTCKEGKKNGFSMSLVQLEEEIEKGSLTYLPQPIDMAQIAIEQGTRVELRDLKQLDLGLEQELRTNLARRFSVINNDERFEVIVNGALITLKDRNYYEKIQFMWYFGDESERFMNRCPNLKHKVRRNNIVDQINGYKVSGWIATVTKPKDIDDQHHTVSIFANGKLIQEDILPEIQDARLFRQYIIGEIDADFIDADDEDDIVTSDRQRINQTDHRYILLREFVSDEIRKIGNSWDDFRKRYTPARAKGVGQKRPPANPQLNFLDNDTIAPMNSSPTEGLPHEAPIGSQEAEVPASTHELNEGSTQTSPVAPSVTARPSPPSREAQVFISNIREAVQSSSLESEFKDIILYDLGQARLAYYNQAYKACVVMLGAVLEGIMLGRLRQADIMERILKDPDLPKQVNERLGGTQNPAYIDRTMFGQALAERLSFEDYRALMDRYIPVLKDLGVENIQHFRNAIHPWSSIRKPQVFKASTAARAMTFLGSLETLTTEILSQSE